MNDERKRALDFLKNHDAGVVASVSSEGKPEAALVFYCVKDDFTICFATFRETRKFQNLNENSRVAFTVAATDMPETVQLEGEARVLTNESEVLQATGGLIDAHTRNTVYFPPLTKLQGGSMEIIHIKPTWIRWIDYAHMEKEFGKEIGVLIKM